MEQRSSGQALSLPPADAVSAVQSMRARPRLADHLEPAPSSDAPGAPGIPLELPLFDRTVSY
ncbi:MAG: hypothetical protein DI537_25695 [Stutzerimonas stutzeri]|nr:MAG: hypothetical protein DI537_25695 [Stutzerimonas stutzeri]